MKNQVVEKIFVTLAQHNLQPRTELVYNSNFELLVAVMLSAQATDISVNKVTAELFKVANTPQALLALGVVELKKYIKSIGLYNTKASNLLKTCNLLVREHAGVVPDNREALENLPGVGRKTANVVLNTAFGLPVIAVDTHVMRVSQRLGLSANTRPHAVELDLYNIIPQAYLSNAHHWLVLHGRYVCKARKPACQACQLSAYCVFLRSS